MLYSFWGDLTNVILFYLRMADVSPVVSATRYRSVCEYPDDDYIKLCCFIYNLIGILVDPATHSFIPFSPLSFLRLHRTSNELCLLLLLMVLYIGFNIFICISCLCGVQ